MRIAAILLVFFLFANRAAAQANDGFQRRDGSMYLIRNGEIRPMAQDVRLPNGRLVTRDGFVVQRDGRRTELVDGQGCTVLGEPTEVRRAANGRLQLASAATVATRYPPAPPRGGPGRGRGHGKAKGRHKHKKHDD